MGRAARRGAGHRQRELVIGMTKFSDEQREAIMAAARATLAKPVEHYEPPPEPLLIRKRHDPEPAPERPMMTDYMRQQQRLAEAATQWETWVAAQIDTAIKAERKAICKIVAQAMADFVGNEREQINRECAKLNSAIEELHRLLAADKAKVVSLPDFRRAN